jgi:predicted phosphodiesterase
MDLLAERDWPAIYGNHDLVVGQINSPEIKPPFDDRERFRTLYWTHDTLRPEHLATVRALPSDLHLRFPGAPPIRLTHGIPGNCFVGIFPFTLEDRAEELLRSVEQPCVVLAHTHRPMDRRVGGLRAFNGGSVGLPFNGDPRAQYMVLDLQKGAWEPTFRQVEYDKSGLRARFEESGMLEAAGPTGELHVLTAVTGDPWSSDFAYWLYNEGAPLNRDIEKAVGAYLKAHGPGHWAFTGEGL